MAFAGATLDFERNSSHAASQGKTNWYHPATMVNKDIYKKPSVGVWHFTRASIGLLGS